jgi:hypothetical protein|tara:strand:+ start:3074 stop:3259 length:186 start_codon:yes stop_codon:yes gene_type:complete
MTQPATYRKPDKVDLATFRLQSSQLADPATMFYIYLNNHLANMTGTDGNLAVLHERASIFA